MERLQEALTRARKKREEIGADGDGMTVERTSEPRREIPQEDKVREAWDSLESLEINEKLFYSNRIVSYFGGSEASPFDLLRTKLVHQAKANSWKRIAITSPTPRCGKTTVVANLAFSLARQADLRTIVVESDMRRPNLARILGVSNQSFARVLTGQEAASQNMVKYGGNVAFATNQVASANPSEILQSNKAQEVLNEIERTYAPDIMLFDTSPILSSDDTLGMLESVDAALLVAAAELTTIEQIDIVEKELAELTQVIGVVLNKSRYAAAGQGYDYGYY